MLLPILLCTPALVATLQAQTYQSQARTTDQGGGPATSADYSNQGSVGLIGGVSASARETAAAAVTRSGYLAQLHDPTALAIAANPMSVPEGLDTRLSAALVMDDATTTALNPGEVSWAVLSGPLAAITTGGVATAAAVYADSDAAIRGNWQGFIRDLAMGVVNTIDDNFGTYAGDTLDDSWQVAHFGEGNPAAAPDRDPDGDGQDNRFEFAAGLVPTDPLSRFLLHIEPVAGEPARERLVFSPCLSDRTYTPLFSTNLLSDSWQGLTNTDVSDNGAERTVTDLDASQPAKFYRIQITPP